MKMAGTINLLGEELSISKNTAGDYITAGYSGYMGFVGEVASQYGGAPGKIAGLVIGISSGVITGVFDKNMNPQKEYDNVIRTAATGFAFGWSGARIGGRIGTQIGASAGPVGAIVGTVLGAVAGGLWGDDIYDNGEKLVKALADNIDQEFEYYDQTIYGKVTKEKFILQSLTDNPTFCMDIFPKYKNYRQIVEIHNKGENLADFIRYDNQTQEATLVADETYHEDYLKRLLEVVPEVKQIELNTQTYNVVNEDSKLFIRNAIDDIPKVSFLLSHILIKTNKTVKNILTCKDFKATKSLHVKIKNKQKGATHGTQQKVA
jgi:hypothetical protein